MERDTASLWNRVIIKKTIDKNGEDDMWADICSEAEKVTTELKRILDLQKEDNQIAYFREHYEGQENESDQRIQLASIINTLFSDLADKLKNLNKTAQESSGCSSIFKTGDFCLDTIEGYLKETVIGKFTKGSLSVVDLIKELEDIFFVIENYIKSPLGRFMFISEDIIGKSALHGEVNYFDEFDRDSLKRQTKIVIKFEDDFLEHLKRILQGRKEDFSIYSNYFERAWSSLLGAFKEPDMSSGKDRTEYYIQLIDAVRIFQQDFMASLAILFRDKYKEVLGDFLEEENTGDGCVISEERYKEYQTRIANGETIIKEPARNLTDDQKTLLRMITENFESLFRYSPLPFSFQTAVRKKLYSSFFRFFQKLAQPFEESCVPPLSLVKDELA